MKSNRLQFGTWAAALGFAVASGAASAPSVTPGPGTLPVAPGPFKPAWDSLEGQYRCPEWFRDAKFGIWAHWTAQCVPEQGDWYAKNMYVNDQVDKKTGKSLGKPSAHYLYHAEHYGPQSKFGFKDIDHLWHAEQWDPEKLIALYQRAGAKYFVALANHHDNFDCYDSKYQPWNSVNLGPKKDIVGGWAKAARAAGLRFGVTVHAGRAWSWFEVAQGADREGPFKGVPYDGKLTKADGKGLWWEGYDPQELYAQNHKPGEKPDQAYCDKFFNRTLDLINKYQPDLLYFDDGVLPLRGSSEEYGLRIAAHLYNSSAQAHGGKNEAVMNTKGLDERQRKALVWDIERGVSERVEPFVWQTDTCIGGWHYNRSTYDKNGYKTPAMVVRMLADIVSKNGNLLLDIPVRGDGSIDDKEVACLEGIAAWTKVNGEAIFGTRPWKVYGEGPSTVQLSEKNRFGGLKDVRDAPYTGADLRFTTQGATLYAILMDWPQGGQAVVKALAAGSDKYPGEVAKVELLGCSEPLKFTRGPDGLRVTLPAQKPCADAFALKITPRS